MGRLSRTEEHYGTFTNSRGLDRQAYIKWDSAKGGYVLREQGSNTILNNTAFPTLKDMFIAGVKFTLATPSQLVAA